MSCWARLSVFAAVFLAIAGCRKNNAVSSEADPAVSSRAQKDAAAQAQFKEDMAFVSGIEGNGASALHAQIFGEGSVGGKTYETFFNSRVKTISTDSCGDPIAVACVYLGGTTAYLTDNYVNSSMPQIYRVAVLYHEARHTESGNDYWQHEACPSPFVDDNGKEIVSIFTGKPLAGKSACDGKLLGSYGISIVMMRNIERYCSNCTEKVRQDAGILADDQVYRLASGLLRGQVKSD